MNVVRLLKLTQPSIPFVKLVPCQLIRPPIHPLQPNLTSSVCVVKVESRTSKSNIDLHREPGAICETRHVHAPWEKVAEIEFLICAVEEAVWEFGTRGCGHKDSITEPRASMVGF